MDSAGHAIHFLKRLQRAPERQADLALALYHQPEAMRAVLTGLGVLGGQRRVALALSDGAEAAHLVVEPDGRFVTCLGPGMGLGPETEVIAYSRLAAHLNRHVEQRRRLELAEDLVGGQPGQMARLLERLFEEADEVSREEMQALSVLQPALKPAYLASLIQRMELLRNATIRLSRLKEPRRKHHEELHAYWSLYHSVGHLLLLSTMSGPSGLEGLISIAQQNETRVGMATILSMLVRFDDSALVLKLVWALSRLTPDLLPELRRNVLNDGYYIEAWLIAMLAFTVAAIRRDKVKRQLFKYLPRIVETCARLKIGHMEDLIETFTQDWFKILFVSLTDPQDLSKITCPAWQETFMAWQEDINPPLPPELAFSRKEDVPEDLALTLVATCQWSIRKVEIIIMLANMTPWLARCSAEDFYFPEAYIRHVRTPWQPEYTMRLLRRSVWKTKLNFQVINSTKHPGRNDPCPCGSGKKYKKCCM